MSEQTFLKEYLDYSLQSLQAFAANDAANGLILQFADAVTESLSRGGKLLVAGNGGSAGDAQHIAGEFVSRLFFDRRPLPAIALTTDTSVLTAVGNDYGYEKVFERQIQGLGNSGDVFLAISTSGKSPNVLRALEAARAQGLVTMGFTGQSAGPMGGLCDLILCAPSANTAIIQQIHIVAAHLLCGVVEQRLCCRPQGPTEPR